MASAWGSSWGSSWGDSWGSVGPVVVKNRIVRVLTSVRSANLQPSVRVGVSGVSVGVADLGAGLASSDITVSASTKRQLD